MSGRLAASSKPRENYRSRILAVMTEEKIDIDERHRRALVVFQQLRGGRLYRSVVVSGVEGDWPPGTPNYYLDGVLFAEHPKPGLVEWAEHGDEFAADIISRTRCSSAPVGMPTAPCSDGFSRDANCWRGGTRNT